MRKFELSKPCWGRQCFVRVPSREAPRILCGAILSPWIFSLAWLVMGLTLNDRCSCSVRAVEDRRIYWLWLSTWVYQCHYIVPNRHQALNPPTVGLTVPPKPWKTQHGQLSIHFSLAHASRELTCKLERLARRWAGMHFLRGHERTHKGFVGILCGSIENPNVDLDDPRQ